MSSNPTLHKRALPRTHGHRVAELTILSTIADLICSAIVGRFAFKRCLAVRKRRELRSNVNGVDVRQRKLCSSASAWPIVQRSSWG